MRTTLTIDDDIYALVTRVAQASRKPIGKVVSETLRRAYQEPRIEMGPDGLIVVVSPAGTPPIKPADIQDAEEAEDLEHARLFARS